VGYMHIENLYKNQAVLSFKEVYALEKVHGTSAHIHYSNDVGGKPAQITLFSGGANHVQFRELFDLEALRPIFDAMSQPSITVFGEAYGGKMQGWSHTYGKDLRFIAFDVKIGEAWLDVPTAERVVQNLGLEFVPYNRVPTTIDALNAERDLPSRVAKRRGIVEDREPEGIVIRPIHEFFGPNRQRIIAKHKTNACSERKSMRDTVVDTEKLKCIENAREAAEEWVTDMRLKHVLDKLPDCNDVSFTGRVIHAMIEDVMREGAGEILDDKATRKEIGKRASVLFKAHLAKTLLSGE
jgi:hypothetical protein